MNAPDRSATVRAFYASHPEHFTVDRHDENRRRSLPALVAHLEAVHPEDAARWGVLVKTDRDNKVPCDVLVWRDTDEHFDVMDSQGGMWNPHGPIHVNAGGPGIWFWGPASVVDPNGEERRFSRLRTSRRRPLPLGPGRGRLSTSHHSRKGSTR